jgi:hypothetical protein
MNSLELVVEHGDKGRTSDSQAANKDAAAWGPGIPVLRAKRTHYPTHKGVSMSIDLR